MNQNQDISGDYNQSKDCTRDNSNDLSGHRTPFYPNEVEPSFTRAKSHQYSKEENTDLTKDYFYNEASKEEKGYDTSFYMFNKSLENSAEFQKDGSSIENDQNDAVEPAILSGNHISVSNLPSYSKILIMIFHRSPANRARNSKCN